MAIANAVVLSTESSQRKRASRGGEISIEDGVVVSDDRGAPPRPCDKSIE